ncbi:MAG: hypothetical protein AAGE84_04535 [Cyanobacteria bacterium P01_G01_bin.39]
MMLTLGVVICPLLLIVMFSWFLRLAIIEIKNKIIKRQQWHSTPCPGCIYFMNCRELQCAVNPCQVLTKSAVDCRDFQAVVGVRVYDYKIKNHYRN